MSGVHLLLLTLGLVQFTKADPAEISGLEGDAANRMLEVEAGECSHAKIKSCDKEACWALEKDETGRRGSWWQVELECRICGNNNPDGCNVESCAYMAKDHNTDTKRYGWISECSVCGVCGPKNDKALGACAADPARAKDCPKPTKGAVASASVSLVKPSLTVLVLGGLATGLAM